MDKRKISEMTCFDKYIMIAPGSDYGKAMWNDISTVENAVLYPYVINTGSKYIDLIHHMHFSFSLNKFFDLPFQSIWQKHYLLKTEDLISEKKYCVIFTDISACRLDTKYLLKLSLMKNVTLVMIAVNVISSKKRLIEKRLPYFKYVFTFDKNDAIKYNLKFYPTNYSVLDCLNDERIKADAFFVGNAKGRDSIVSQLADLVIEKGGIVDFYLNGVKKRKQKNDNVTYNKWLSYVEIINKIHSTNCLIEIVSEGQVGLTLRAMEAICYNKKLLTNNKSVKQLKYFSTGYIQYFENLDDIDVDFVLDRIPVDYKYEGDFSPIHLLEEIINLEMAE